MCHCCWGDLEEEDVDELWHGLRWDIKQCFIYTSAYVTTSHVPGQANAEH